MSSGGRRRGLVQQIPDQEQHDHKPDAEEHQFPSGAFPADFSAQVHDAPFFGRPQLIRTFTTPVRVKPVLTILAAIGLEPQPADQPFEDGPVRAVCPVIAALGADHRY